MSESGEITEPTPLDDEGKGRPPVSTDRIRTIVGGLLLVAAILGIGFYAYAGKQEGDGRSRAVNSQVTIPETADLALAQIDELTLSPDQLQPLTPQDAKAWNDALPFSRDPVRPVAPFVVPLADPADYRRAVDCLSAAVYYEAANESTEGKLAVAQVVLNRVRHPTYPKSVCGVVFEGSQRSTGCQFSFTCDGAMARRPSAAGWANARAIAEAALNGLVSGQVGAATHYHADYVAPYWADRLSKSARLGTHIFYRFPGRWSEASALSLRYAGLEPVIGKMAPLASPDEPIMPSADLSLELTALAAPQIVPDQNGIQEQAAPTAPLRSAVAQPVTEPSGPAPVTVTPETAPAPTPARPAVQNPLTTTPGEQRRGRLARPGSW